MMQNVGDLGAAFMRLLPDTSDIEECVAIVCASCGCDQPAFAQVDQISPSACLVK